MENNELISEFTNQYFDSPDARSVRIKCGPTDADAEYMTSALETYAEINELDYLDKDLCKSLVQTAQKFCRYGKESFLGVDMFAPSAYKRHDPNNASFYPNRLVVVSPMIGLSVEQYLLITEEKENACVFSGFSDKAINVYYVNPMLTYAIPASRTAIDWLTKPSFDVISELEGTINRKYVAMNYGNEKRPPSICETFASNSDVDLVGKDLTFSPIEIVRCCLELACNEMMVSVASKEIGRLVDHIDEIDKGKGRSK